MAKIPEEVFFHKKLTPLTKCLYAYLKDKNLSPDNYIHSGQIKEDASMSAPCVHYARTDLVKNGFLNRKYNKLIKKNISESCIDDFDNVLLDVELNYRTRIVLCLLKHLYKKNQYMSFDDICKMMDANYPSMYYHIARLTDASRIKYLSLRNVFDKNFMNNIQIL